MATNLSIDMQLLEDALKIGRFKSKKDTVNMALAEFIKKRKAAEILSLFGTIEYDEDYDYKKLRFQGQ
ncbi:MAG: type II toxin-antitoxin system VapB family antitoxin [Synergistaceae bacterium]|nr:type II toxin-antitoxin system VapB family antitoxin [Synergistaceae bacterium]